MVMDVAERLQLAQYQEKVLTKLMEAEAAVVDAMAKVNFYKASMQLVITEMQVLAAVVMKRAGVKRMVISHAEYLGTDQEEELHSEQQPDGVIIYEMRSRRDVRKKP